jgi:hypothetical protein
MDIEIRPAVAGDIEIIANARAQRTYRGCGLVDSGYFVMEEDFSGAVTRVGG